MCHPVIGFPSGTVTTDSMPRCSYLTTERSANPWYGDRTSRHRRKARLTWRWRSKSCVMNTRPRFSTRISIQTVLAPAAAVVFREMRLGLSSVSRSHVTAFDRSVTHGMSLQVCAVHSCARSLQSRTTCHSLARPQPTDAGSFEFSSSSRVTSSHGFRSC